MVTIISYIVSQTALISPNVFTLSLFFPQIWRALRLVVDTGLHYKGFTRQRALDLFAKYAWDKSDIAQKEVLRYQSNPGQATAYMIGQLDIWRYRNETKKALGDKFSLKEFHFQALSQGNNLYVRLIR